MQLKLFQRSHFTPVGLYKMGLCPTATCFCGCGTADFLHCLWSSPLVHSFWLEDNTFSPQLLVFLSSLQTSLPPTMLNAFCASSISTLQKWFRYHGNYPLLRQLTPGWYWLMLVFHYISLFPELSLVMWSAGPIMELLILYTAEMKEATIVFHVYYFIVNSTYV